MNKKDRRDHAGNDDPKHNRQHKRTDRVAQQDRTEQALLTGTKSTFELRDLYNVLHPAGRVMELVDQGAEIHVERRRTVDRDGREHFGIAHYSLIKRRPRKEQ
ncbi:helix-turn-helix domain-containing protein [Deefgea tanakiae]|uniref:Helix-turn-helix domain-containing protein n=1 Tax=Deefgea tanakiae TaxID=2865840 RepID=A0ABX8Z7T1_9NEIS|nr:helix-turn-helix domain-containing protein [Deefgea tanakiae]QZA78651.1 helix-turn-helix domain-containing protein [Deefgea tanakiae]